MTRRSCAESRIATSCVPSHAGEWKAVAAAVPRDYQIRRELFAFLAAPWNKLIPCQQGLTSGRGIAKLCMQGEVYFAA